MKTGSQIKFDTVIKEGLQELLKPLGFKKKANNFYLQPDTVGQIINVQKSRWGNKDSISFTINAADVAVPPLNKLILYGEFGQLHKAKREYEQLLSKTKSTQLRFLTTVKEYGQKYGLDK